MLSTSKKSKRETIWVKYIVTIDFHHIYLIGGMTTKLAKTVCKAIFTFIWGGGGTICPPTRIYKG
jgi:hypothetical protein